MLSVSFPVSRAVESLKTRVLYHFVFVASYVVIVRGVLCLRPPISCTLQSEWSGREERSLPAHRWHHSSPVAFSGTAPLGTAFLAKVGLILSTTPWPIQRPVDAEAGCLCSLFMVFSHKLIGYPPAIDSLPERATSSKGIKDRTTRAMNGVACSV